MGENNNMRTDSINAASVMKPADKVLWSIIGQDLMLLNLQNGRYYSFNKVGAQIWHLLDGRRTIGDIIQGLSRYYPDMHPDQIQADVQDVLRQCYHEQLSILCNDKDFLEERDF